MFGRKTKLRLNQSHIPDLNWELATIKNKTDNVITYTQMKVNDCVTTPVYTQLKVSIVVIPYNLRPRKSK